MKFLWLRTILFLIALVFLRTDGNAQIFFFEDFENSCQSNCLAGTYIGPNGQWTVTNIGVNSPTPNEWFISCAENGMAVGACGSGCIGAGDATLHIGSTDLQLFATVICPTGDCGAAYYAGLPGFDDVTTNKRAVSPIINCAAALCPPTLSFKYIFNGQPPSDYFIVEYFDGSMWTVLDNPVQTALCPSGQGEWTNYSLTLPASSVGNSNVQIGFRWINNNDGAGADPSVAIDNVIIQTPPPPDPAFTIDSTDLCIGQSTAMTLNDVQVGVTYEWFENGTLFYTGTTPPDYTGVIESQVEISVNADNGCGAVTASQFINVINCNLLQAGIDVSLNNICVNDCIDINDASTGAIISWEWTFTGANITSSTDTNPGSVCFNTVGQQTVALTVTDGIDTASVSVFINVSSCTNPAPIADISASANPICVGDCITYTNSSTFEPGATFAWTFTGGTPNSSAVQDPAQICYAAAGGYTAKLVVTNPDGQQDSMTLIITVNNCTPPPIADITASTNPVCEGDCITYTNNSTFDPGATFDWTFTGGTPNSSAIQNPVQICYATAGSYTAKLVITNPDGQQDSMTLNITVNNCAAPPVADFSISTNPICSGQCVDFTNNSTAAANATYNWTFPGGTPNSFNGLNPPQICFNTAGIFTIKLVVSDNGGTDSISIALNVQNCPIPIALFSASALDICQGDSVLFTDQSSNALDWNWIFAGGSPASFVGQNPPYVIYSVAGVYLATLTVTDGAGLDSSYNLTINVTNCGAPVPAFTASLTSICEGDCIQFFDQSTGNPQGWYWDFPGGVPSFSTQQNPPYICYNSPGAYPVTLRVFNNLGIDSLTIQAYIIVNSSSQVSTSFDSINIILGESIILDASGGISYIWYPDFFLSDDSVANPIATPTDTTIYTVVMTDLNGCTSTAQVKVNVRPPNQVFIPNMFSPNSDAVNDFIKLYTTGVIAKSEFHIFDRWGNRVFFADDVNERWDGTYKGRDCNTGVYAYFYRVVFADGRVLKGKGDITLIR